MESVTPKVHFITFYTDGKLGELDLTAAETYVRVAVKPHVDSYTAYTREKVCQENGEQYVRNYDDKYYLNKWNPHGHKIGFYAFKPFILLSHLKKVAPGDIVIYRDVNVFKYPDYLRFANQLRKTANEILKMINYDIFMPIQAPWSPCIKNHCKTQVIRELGGDHPYIYEYPLLIAHTIIVRNTTRAVKHLERWLDAMKFEWLSPLPNDNPHPDFQWHTPEQGIFSVLCARMILDHELPADYPRYYIAGGGRALCLSMITSARDNMEKIALLGNLTLLKLPKELITTNDCDIKERLNIDTLLKRQVI
jgi:hypothetical protein